MKTLTLENENAREIQHECMNYKDLNLFSSASMKLSNNNNKNSISWYFSISVRNPVFCDDELNKLLFLFEIKLNNPFLYLCDVKARNAVLC